MSNILTESAITEELKTMTSINFQLSLFNGNLKVDYQDHWISFPVMDDQLLWTIEYFRKEILLPIVSIMETNHASQ